MKLRVGVAGGGQAGERQAIGFAALPNAQIVGIADVDSMRATRLASKFDARSFQDWHDLLRLDLDILVVALPHNLHAAPAEEAASCGVHVMMEKPIATTLEDGRRIIEACRDAGVQLSISFVHRYREEVQRAKEWLDHVGYPQIARESMSLQRTAAHSKWITSRTVAGGGVLMYGAIHGVDRLRWFLDSEVVQVTARTHQYTPDTEVEDGVAALLTFSNGAVATLTSNAPLYRAQPAPWETEVYADAGMVRVRTREWAEVSSDSSSERYTARDDPATQLPHYNFTRQAAAFTEAILQRRSPPVTGEDGQLALAVCLAIYESAETGQPIDLTY